MKSKQERQKQATKTTTTIKKNQFKFYTWLLVKLIDILKISPLKKKEIHSQAMALFEALDDVKSPHLAL